MSDQTTTVDRELDAALADIRHAETSLKAAGAHLRQAVSGLPETGISEVQTVRYSALVDGIARALHELDKALDTSGVDR